MFDQLEKLSGQTYASTLPKPGSTGDTTQEKVDVAFRVIADHIRTCSFAIADGINPGNSDRNYVIRRILRRAVSYGRTLGFHEPFLYKLVDVLAATMGDIFPEIHSKKEHVKEVIKQEEEAFIKNLDRGVPILESEILMRAIGKGAMDENLGFSFSISKSNEPTRIVIVKDGISHSFTHFEILSGAWSKVLKATPAISGEDAFRLYDTYGFPLDLTQLRARELGVAVDLGGFNALMEEQRARARAAQKRTIVVAMRDGPPEPTLFVGFDENNLLNYKTGKGMIHRMEDGEVYMSFAKTPFYAAMGGQAGDTGYFTSGKNRPYEILDTVRVGDFILHKIKPEDERRIPVGDDYILNVDTERRRAIERHHTVTHLLHWALHQIVSPGASQKGSSVTPEKLTFDFNSPALTPAQIAAVETLVNERIAANAPVTWANFPYAAVKSRPDIMQFFGDKYGDQVRVVQIGGTSIPDSHHHAIPKLDGYSMELCGGTHVRATGVIGLFKILHEGAVAAGVRRIEAVAGDAALKAVESLVNEASALHAELVKAGLKPTPLVAVSASAPSIESVHALEHQLHHLQQSLADHRTAKLKHERAALQQNAAALADTLAATAFAQGPLHFVVADAALPAASLRDLAVQLSKKIGPGVIVLGTAADGKVGLAALCSPEAVAAGHNAGQIVGTLCAQLGGKGGGKPDFAQGGGKDAAQLPAALAHFRQSLA
ncbi:MAG: alanine--tRNA ligase-related protein [Opitutales bacterium]